MANFFRFYLNSCFLFKFRTSDLLFQLNHHSFQVFRMCISDMKPQIHFLIITFLAIETFEFKIWKMLLFDMFDDFETTVATVEITMWAVDTFSRGVVTV